jgi:SEC-C motif-containing protein
MNRAVAARRGVKLPLANVVLRRAAAAIRANVNLTPIGAVSGGLACFLFPLKAEEVPHATRRFRRTAIFFEPMSKRRQGFPSEKKVKRGIRIVHGEKLLEEKLGRDDLCPCGSGKRFKKCCLHKRRF